MGVFKRLFGFNKTDKPKYTLGPTHSGKTAKMIVSEQIIPKTNKEVYACEQQTQRYTERRKKQIKTTDAAVQSNLSRIINLATVNAYYDNSNIPLYTATATNSDLSSSHSNDCSSPSSSSSSYQSSSNDSVSSCD